MISKDDFLKLGVNHEEVFSVDDICKFMDVATVNEYDRCKKEYPYMFFNESYMKRCSACNKKLPVYRFPIFSPQGIVCTATIDGRSYMCTPCSGESE